MSKRSRAASICFLELSQPKQPTWNLGYTLASEFTINLLHCVGDQTDGRLGNRRVAVQALYPKLYLSLVPDGERRARTRNSVVLPRPVWTP